MPGSVLKPEDVQSLPGSIRGSRVGVVVLSPSLQLLHLNQEAIFLLDQMNRHDGPLAQGVLPPRILEMCDAVYRQQGFQAQTVEGREGKRITLYGFQLAGHRSRHGPILIVLKEVDDEHQRDLTRATETFRLTDRETAVATQVVRGLTNKEIGAVLGIAEQTVKQHIKHLMEKTGARSRTALLTALLLPPE